MRILRLGLAIICFVTVSARSWAQSKNIHENADPYTNLRTLFLEVPTRSCPEDPSPNEHDPDVHLLFTAHEQRDGTVLYFLTPELDHGYTLNVRSHGTIDTLIDNVPGSFTTNMGSTVVTNYSGGSSYLHETVPFLVSQADLSKISNTNGFQFRVNGQHRAIQRCIDAKKLRDLPEFLSAASEYATMQPPSDPQAQHLVQRTNSSTHLKVIKLDNIATEPCPGDPSQGIPSPRIHLDISANQRGDGGVWYFITTVITSGPTFGLRRGDTLQIKMDGKTSSFRTINGSTLTSVPDASGNPIINETTVFHVHQPDLIALSKTPMAEFSLSGSNQIMHRCVEAKDLMGLPEFIGDTTTLYSQPVAEMQHP